MLTIEKLRDFGADTADGLRRCMNQEEFYLSLVDRMLTSPAFTELKKALDEERYGDAFENAHQLKGVLANLSITPLYEVCASISDQLKAGIQKDYSEDYKRLFELKEELAELAAED